MSTTSTRLRSSEHEPFDPARVSEALRGSFTVHLGPSQVVRRAELDTFDRRLAAAGLALEQRLRGPHPELLLRTGDEEHHADAAGLELPALAPALPPGRVKDVVAPAMGIRALMPGPESRRRLQRLELRNEDEKLVVLLELDGPSEASNSVVDVVVRPLRGYDADARRAIATLRRLGLDQVPAEDDRSGAATKRPAPSDGPAGQLLAVVLGNFLDVMRDNLPGLLDDVDTEFLHDFRVAVRRTRSTLKLSRSVLPTEFREKWEPAFKWLGDLTTPVRDLDVYELDMPTMATWLVGANPADLDPFRMHLRRRRNRERATLVGALRSARFRRLVNGWQQEIGRLAAGAESDLTAKELAGKSIRKAGRRVLRDGQAVHADSPAEDLHALRKRCKELRYALEVFSPVVDTKARKSLVADLKVLQDVLGRFQDSEVQRAALRGFATEMMADGTSAEAVLAMGELIGHLDTAQDDARREFDNAFARLSRPVNRHRLNEMAGR